MSQHQQQTIRCLICNQMEQRRTLIGHISEHIGLKPHACEHCDFQTAFENEAMDHEADNFGHHVNINDRNNCNLEQVLDRPLGNNRSRIVAPATSTISSALSDNIVSNSATSAIVYNRSKQMRSSFINNVNSNNNELAISSTTAEFSPGIEPASHQQLYPPSSPIAVAQYASEQAVASSADILDIKPLSITETVRSHSRTSAIVEIDEIHENEPDHQRLMPVQPGNIAAHVYVTEVAEQSQQQQPQKSRGRPISRCGYVRRQPRKKQMRSGDVVRRKSYVLRSQLKALMR